MSRRRRRRQREVFNAAGDPPDPVIVSQARRPPSATAPGTYTGIDRTEAPRLVTKPEGWTLTGEELAAQMAEPTAIVTPKPKRKRQRPIRKTSKTKAKDK